MASILSGGQISRVSHGLIDNGVLRMNRGYLRSSSISSHLCRNPNTYYRSYCSNGHIYNSDIEGIESILNGSLDVYLSDYLALDYMIYKQTDCSLSLTKEDFVTNGYSFGLSKTLINSEEKV